MNDPTFHMVQARLDQMADELRDDMQVLRAASRRHDLARDLVYRAVDEERDYQDNLGPDRTDGSRKTVGDYLTMLRSYLTKAESAWTDNNSNIPALHQIRKIAAIAVRCMEEHGAPRRGT